MLDDEDDEHEELKKAYGTNVSSVTKTKSEVLSPITEEEHIASRKSMLNNPKRGSMTNTN